MGDSGLPSRAWAYTLLVHSVFIYLKFRHRDRDAQGPWNMEASPIFSIFWTLECKASDDILFIFIMWRIIEIINK